MKHVDDRPDRPKQPRMRLTTRGKTVATALGLTAAVVAGSNIQNRIENDNAHKTLPACEVPEHPGVTVNGLADDIESLGSDVKYGEASIVAADGHTRKHESDPETRDGSIMIQNGDLVKFPHVNPAVCYKVGGHIVGLT